MCIRDRPNSVWVVPAPFVHFQISLSLVSSALFLINTLFLAAVRQVTALTGQLPVKQASVPSSQLWPRAQGVVPPPQTPAVHVCVPLQKLVSSQLVPSAWKPSAGQLSPTPSQLSATSQAPAEARHCAVLLPAVGQNLEEPSQASAVSQTPTDARQVVPFGSTASAGQATFTPSQVSAASQASAVVVARHTVVL